jgi:hypothetical protein
MAKAELATSAAGPDGGNEARRNQHLSKVGGSGARPDTREPPLRSKQARRTERANCITNSEH